MHAQSSAIKLNNQHKKRTRRNVEKVAGAEKNVDRLERCKVGEQIGLRAFHRRLCLQMACSKSIGFICDS